MMIIVHLDEDEDNSYLDDDDDEDYSCLDG